jgi:glutamyl-tRNA(Gln) amidotransferase subunit E
MRPTLSELGEYDGTALMEFKTKKEIVYRIKNETACTYEIDDTPPFPIDREALDKAIEISLLSKMNIVGEVHITRKQYLDGSIPTGFQRTAIIGVEGEIPLQNKKVRLVQLSLEEDSCREMWDIGHQRGFKTDRLGIPLIETVTYPDCVNPDETKEACNYIRFLNRSTGKVRTGIGSGRQDVNVSCRGGSRVEIKGVAHTKWIPELTHNECFRQWALLFIKDILSKKVLNSNKWKVTYKVIHFPSYNFKYKQLRKAHNNRNKIIAINLPQFRGILSHFTQPGRMFADEISDRLKVIACLEKSNMTHTEEFKGPVSNKDWGKIQKNLKSGEEDAQLLVWGPASDISTAVETVEERCRMAFERVPNETRKSFCDGTTIFERVLPGADRMYPDTDSAPIPLEDDYIEKIRKKLPSEVIDRYKQLRQWNVPEDTFTYILSKNLYPIAKKIVVELNFEPKFICTFIGHYLKFVEGQFKRSQAFEYSILFDLFRFLKEHNLDAELAKKMLPVIYEHPKMDFESVLTSLNFKPIKEDEILSKVKFLKNKFKDIQLSKNNKGRLNWIMGELRHDALGNINLKKLHTHIQMKLS